MCRSLFVFNEKSTLQGGFSVIGLATIRDCIGFYGGVTQIRDLEHCCIALIRQIKNLDKGVKKGAPTKADAPKNA